MEKIGPVKIDPAAPNLDAKTCLARPNVVDQIESGRTSCTFLWLHELHQLHLTYSGWLQCTVTQSKHSCNAFFVVAKLIMYLHSCKLFLAIHSYWSTHTNKWSIVLFKCIWPDWTNFGQGRLVLNAITDPVGPNLVDQKWSSQTDFLPRPKFPLQCSIIILIVIPTPILKFLVCFLLLYNRTSFICAETWKFSIYAISLCMCHAQFFNWGVSLLYSSIT